MNATNTNKRIAWACSGIIALGMLVVFLPGILDLDMMQMGFGISTIGVFVVIVGIASVIVFARMARLFDTVLQKDNILVHWTYSPEEWQQYTEEEYTEDRNDKIHLLLIISVFAVVAGVILWVAYRDNPLSIVGIVVGLIVLIGLVALLSTALSHRRNRSRHGEVYIARDGALVNGRFHVWKGAANSLGSVSYREARRSSPGSLPRVDIRYSSPNLGTRSYYAARIPVPRGQEEAARKVVKEISVAHFARKRSSVQKRS